MGSSSTKLPFPPTDPSTSTPPQAGNLPPDPWLCSSLLQKSIRRGDADTAADAGVTLHRLRGSSIWTRLLVIAFEDIGSASPGTLVNAVTACTDPAWRKQAGGNTAVVASLARKLAHVAKDRSADHLICCARSHPSLARVRQLLTSLPVHERITMAMDRSLPLTEQAAAAWYSSGIEWGDESRVGPGDLDALLLGFEEAGVPRGLLDATKIAAKRTREPITVMIPVLWLAISADRQAHVVDCPIPSSPVIAGIPAYCMDMHTRSGRRAIDLFSQENAAVRASLDEHVPVRFRRQAAYLASFYVDGAPVARRLQWSQADALEHFGIENDFIALSVATQAVPALLGTVRGNLDDLDATRARVLTAALRANGMGQPA